MSNLRKTAEMPAIVIDQHRAKSVSVYRRHAFSELSNSLDDVLNERADKALGNIEFELDVDTCLSVL